MMRCAAVPFALARESACQGGGDADQSSAPHKSLRVVNSGAAHRTPRDMGERLARQKPHNTTNSKKNNPLAGTEYALSAIKNIVGEPQKLPYWLTGDSL